MSEGGLLDSFAISTSLFFIVMTSVLTGTVLPFALAFVGIDPANAGTTIQVSCSFDSAGSESSASSSRPRYPELHLDVPTPKL